MAKAADADGNALMAAHLFVVAFEKASARGSEPHADAVDGLRKAMDLACACKERALAEHIFERLEPYCTADEVRQNAERLNALALDKLEDFGLSRKDMQEIAGYFAGDGFGAAVLSHLGIDVPSSNEQQDAGSDESESQLAGQGSQPSLFLPPSTPFGKIIEHKPSGSAQAKPAANAGNAIAKPNAAQQAKKAQQAKQDQPEGVELLGGYDELIGYDAAIEHMHEWGIGMSGDERFQNFLEMLSRRHGIATLPSLQTLVFRAKAREDATHFMTATVGELSLPTVRMYMEQTPMGVPMLCIVASADFKSRFHFMRNGFDMPTVLMLEDVDLWASPLAGQSGDFDMGQVSQVARGAREATLFIRSAVENPNVTVVASCESGHPLDVLVRELLEPIEEVFIELPTREERAAIWKHAATLYPSMRYVNLDDLVRYSESMSRYDIYMAAREAVEQAYQLSVRKRAYVPVTSDNIFDKIAAYQPLDSDEYTQMEESVVASFRKELEHIDDILDEGIQ
ncbi:MAG: ribonucleotide reductase subunit alpha [Eggerthellaceae bacterium]|nr:ribonucleotide reductase subunit alpha [Eggerthellaceae bacterium]